MSRGRWRVVVVAVVALTAIVVGIAWIFAERPNATTDDAYVQTGKTLISPKVRGMVVSVEAAENRPVKAGDVLASIDPQEYDLKIAGAEGDLMAAEAAQKAGRAGLARLDAEEQLATSQVKGAETLAGAKGAADPTLRQAFEAARGQALVAARTQGEIEADIAQADAAAFRARTELDAAKLEKAQTQVVAPVTGVVADIQTSVGALVQPGVTLMTIVDIAHPTITANFKETQVGRMRPGAAATVRIDALPGRTFTGRLDSLAPASGSQFALLPFEPGAGNFSKIVQRIAARIVLDPGQPDLNQLKAGLSAEVTVKLSPAS